MMTDANAGDVDGWQRVVKHCTDVMAKRGLELQPIDPDGNCLFRAVGCALGRESEYGDLRQQCIEYMKAHRDDFAPFISDEDEGFSALHPNTKDVDLFDHRMKRMAEDACWGAHVELTALAQLLKTNVLVHQADDSPPVQVEVDGEDKCIQIVFHPDHHSGAHYDCCRPIDTAKPALPSLKEALETLEEYKAKEKVRQEEEEAAKKKAESQKGLTDLSGGYSKLNQKKKKKPRGFL